MKEILLIKNGEIALKGLNRNTFESILIKNIRFRLKDLGKFNIRVAQSTVYIEPLEENIDFETAVERIRKIFGIAVFSRAAVAEKNYEDIKKTALEYLQDLMPEVKTFKVDAKRSDKHFPMTSPDIMREIGGDILEAFPHLKVDVHQPEVTVTVEIRDYAAYIHAKRIPGAGGLPVGSGGKAMLLISGGIDSPVAGYMMAKRGLELQAIHFVSPPYTSDRAREKVESLCAKMGEYCGRIRFYCVPFTKIQEALRDHCPEELFTLLMRRLMMEIAQHFADKEGAQALVTGESLGQVASQTLSALACTDAVCRMPVLRPLIGMDKSEIVEISRKIDTYELSILPYEDCCTVFTPKHPKTRPSVEEVAAAQAGFDFASLVREAIEGTEVKMIRPSY
ncbi:MAG: tRNA 4-thiouridine(8) synthase ThiI [Clostridiales bacterium]|nr:tRNA 4-thiouridine(8) synthase ThiI [Clostridiales bacterium]